MIKIIVHDDIELTKEEKEKIFQQEQAYWSDRGRELNTIHVKRGKDEDELVVTSTAKQQITRTRRITGYLSNVNNFNDAKKAELKDRVSHLVTKSSN